MQTHAEQETERLQCAFVILLVLPGVRRYCNFIILHCVYKFRKCTVYISHIKPMRWQQSINIWTCLTLL